jgi:hypothetical protein
MPDLKQVHSVSMMYESRGPRIEIEKYTGQHRQLIVNKVYYLMLFDRNENNIK